MKSLLLLLLLAIAPACIFAQIPNSGFEDWTAMVGYNTPNLWATLNGVTASANTFTCVKGTPGNPGNAYIKLTSKSVTGMGKKPGIAVSGVMNTTTMQPVSGFPFTGRPEALTGNWEYMAYGTDKGYISVLMTKWNPSFHRRDTIAYKSFSLEGMVMAWAGFTIPISYKSNEFPDSAIIVLSASNFNGAATAANSFLYVDKLSFKNTIWLSTNYTPQIDLRIYPNPVNSILNIELPWTDKEVTIDVYDTFGKLVLNVDKRPESRKTELNVRNLLPGSYFLRIRNGNEIITGKFIRN